ncbi:MAG: NAD(P)-dependent oxidoreductase [Abditibacteriales bacterium]|nr:NAD(P)-dependent oxidoreductase [Abditibacteriales bacterium]MDW8367296.1 NAD(P)-dependent oxidoreductase [Abditibacteriales bacterium]
MHILITGAATPLGQAVAELLKDEHALKFIEGAVVEEDEATQAVKGVEAIVHLAVVCPDHITRQGEEREQQLLDHAARGTYNLVKAAVAADVERIVYGSSLCVVENYPPDYVVTENWKPRPNPEAASLAPFMGELICREFTNVENIAVICLRFGVIVREEDVQGQPFNPLWVDVRDAARAVQLALTVDVGKSTQHHRWRLWHISAAHPNSRYLVNNAKQGLKWEPKYDFS